MDTDGLHVIPFLKKLMERRKQVPNQLAKDLGLNHATVSRWLSGKTTPSLNSCKKLADYSYVSIDELLYICGHLSDSLEESALTLPEFREYAQRKYPAELDEDIITMVEDLIERRRSKRQKQRAF